MDVSNQLVCLIITCIVKVVISHLFVTQWPACIYNHSVSDNTKQVFSREKGTLQAPTIHSIIHL